MSGAGCVSCCRARRCNLMGKSQILSRASYFKRWYQSCLATPVFFWGGSHGWRTSIRKIAELAAQTEAGFSSKVEYTARRPVVWSWYCTAGYLLVTDGDYEAQEGSDTLCCWYCAKQARLAVPLANQSLVALLTRSLRKRHKRNISPEQDGWALAFTRRSNFNFLLSEILSNFSGVASKCLLVKSSVCLVRATTS